MPRGDHVIQVVASLDSNDTPHVEFRHLPQGWLEEGVGHHQSNSQEADKANKAPYHFAVDGASFEIICNNFRADLLPYLVVKASSGGTPVLWIQIYKIKLCKTRIQFMFSRDGRAFLKCFVFRVPPLLYKMCVPARPSLLFR